MYGKRKVGRNRKIKSLRQLKFRQCVSRTVFVFLWATCWASLINVEALASVDRFTTCTPVDKFIEIRVAVKTIPATASEPQRLVWVLNNPRAEVIQLPAGDTVLREAILAIFQQIADAGAEVGVGKGGNPQAGD